MRQARRFHDDATHSEGAPPSTRPGTCCCCVFARLRCGFGALSKSAPCGRVARPGACYGSNRTPPPPGPSSECPVYQPLLAMRRVGGPLTGMPFHEGSTARLAVDIRTQKRLFLPGQGSLDARPRATTAPRRLSQGVPSSIGRGLVGDNQPLVSVGLPQPLCVIEPVEPCSVMAYHVLPSNLVSQTALITSRVDAYHHVLGYNPVATVGPRAGRNKKNSCPGFRFSGVHRCKGMINVIGDSEASAASRSVAREGPRGEWSS